MSRSDGASLSVLTRLYFSHPAPTIEMPVILRVHGLHAATEKMRRVARKSERELPLVVGKAMGESMVREIIVRSKRPRRPRQARFVSDGGFRSRGHVRFGWYGTDYSAVDAYLSEPIQAATTTGFRRGVQKARRWFRFLRL